MGEAESGEETASVEARFHAHEEPRLRTTGAFCCLQSTILKSTRRRESAVRERQVNVRVVPTGKAIEESVDLAYEIFNRVFRRVPEKLKE